MSAPQPPAPTPSAPSPLAEFGRFVGDFHSVYALIAKAAVAGPLLDLVLNLGPPWPSRLTVSTAMVLLQFLALMVSFAVWRQGNISAELLKRRLVQGAVGAGAAFLLLYIPLFIAFIRDDPDPYARVVVGWKRLPEIVRMEQADPRQNWSDERLLREFVDGQTGVTDVWEPWTVYVARYLLLLAWLVTMLAYAVTVSAFVAIQYRRLGDG